MYSKSGLVVLKECRNRKNNRMLDYPGASQNRRLESWNRSGLV